MKANVRKEVEVSAWGDDPCLCTTHERLQLRLNILGLGHFSETLTTNTMVNLQVTLIAIFTF
jgi:hypothetical protein